MSSSSNTSNTTASSSSDNATQQPDILNPNQMNTGTQLPTHNVFRPSTMREKVINGLKATLDDPEASEEAKKSARERLDGMGA
ncbi:hypothetical protein IWZ01DRAFT_541472 [Phyllosticta capitalensis]